MVTTAYPQHPVGVQNYLPVLSEKRVLTATEETLRQKGLQQWLGKLFPSYGTELWQLLATRKSRHPYGDMPLERLLE